MSILNRDNMFLSTCYIRAFSADAQVEGAPLELSVDHGSNLGDIKCHGSTASTPPWT